MLSLIPSFGARAAPRLLFIGAHCDDIEIGCGGTVLELLERYPRSIVDWVVLSSDTARSAEAKRAARLFLRRCKEPRVTIQKFRNSFFPMVATEIKEFFEALKREVSPDLVFTHFRDDLHQDHKIVGELTWNTFRDHLILEYEIPKYDGGLGSPNVFVPLRPKNAARKVQILMKVFGSQRSKRWFTPDTFEGLMRLRGIECNAESAEAYYARKITF